MLIEIDGVVTAFISFCSIRELSPATVSSYIDGLRFFSTDLDGVASIPNLEVVSRLLTGLAKSGKRPLPRKSGIPCALLRRIIASLPSVPGLSAYDVTLYTTCFIVCYFGAFRVSEFLFSSDQMKLLSRDRVSFHIDGSVRFILPKTKNNSAGPAQEVLFPSLAPDPICPVSAVRSFLARRPVTLGSAPFFIDQSGSPVLPKRFTDVLRLAEPARVQRLDEALLALRPVAFPLLAPPGAGQDESGRDSIHRDSERTEFYRHLLGHSDERMLG